MGKLSVGVGTFLGPVVSPPQLELIGSMGDSWGEQSGSCISLQPPPKSSPTRTKVLVSGTMVKPAARILVITNRGSCASSLSQICRLIRQTVSWEDAAPRHEPWSMLLSSTGGTSAGQALTVLGNVSWQTLFQLGGVLQPLPLRCMVKNIWFPSLSRRSPPSSFTPSPGRCCLQSRVLSSLQTLTLTEPSQSRMLGLQSSSRIATITSSAHWSESSCATLRLMIPHSWSQMEGSGREKEWVYSKSSSTSLLVVNPEKVFIKQKLSHQYDNGYATF